jgi:maleate isomerase
MHDVGLGLADDAEFAKVEPKEWHSLASLSHQKNDADAYFLSFTAIWSTQAIEAIERDLARPVVTSNQALAWHILRISGIDDQTSGLGALFSHC